MLPELLQTPNLFYLLHRIDIDLAGQQKKLVVRSAVGHYTIPTTTENHGADLICSPKKLG